jgi:hypothetical protein
MITREKERDEIPKPINQINILALIDRWLTDAGKSFIASCRHYFYSDSKFWTELRLNAGSQNVEKNAENVEFIRTLPTAPRRGKVPPAGVRCAC